MHGNIFNDKKKKMFEKISTFISIRAEQYAAIKFVGYLSTNDEAGFVEILSNLE